MGGRRERSAVPVRGADRPPILGEARRGAIIRRPSRRCRARSRRSMQRADPDALRSARRGIAAAERPSRRTTRSPCTRHAATSTSAIRRGAYAVTLDAVLDGDAQTARRWLLVRDFRKATRFTRPGVDATAAIDDLAAGETSPEDAATAVQKDLLDAYQARLFDYLGEGGARGRPTTSGPALAESAALVRGYWLIIDDEYAGAPGQAERDAADAAFEELEAAAIRGDVRGLRGGPRRCARAPRRLHGGAVHAGGAGSPGRPADPLPRAGPGRVGPRHRGRAT